MPEEEDLEMVEMLADVVEGGLVMWKSSVSDLIRLRPVVQADESMIHLSDVLCFDRGGRCCSDFRHGRLIEPSADHRAKYLRQRRSAVRVERIHQKRLDKANAEYASELQRWACETVRDLAETESEAQRIELLLQAALSYLRVM